PAELAPARLGHDDHLRGAAAERFEGSLRQDVAGGSDPEDGRPGVKRELVGSQHAGVAELGAETGDRGGLRRRADVEVGHEQAEEKTARRPQPPPPPAARSYHGGGGRASEAASPVPTPRAPTPPRTASPR